MSAFKPNLDLTVEIEAPDGTQRRWASHRGAQDRPQGIGCGTARFDGFKTGECTLLRRIDVDWPDLNLYDTIRYVGADGSVAYEGRVAAQPRSMDAGHSITVQTVGWMAHAKDRKFTEIYIDRDLSQWGPGSATYLAARVAAGKNHVGDRVILHDDSGYPSLRETATGKLNQTEIEAFYDAGPGLRVGAVYTSGVAAVALGGGDTNWEAYIEGWSDDHTFANQSTNIRTVLGTAQSHSPNTRYAAVLWRYNLASAGTADAEYAVNWDHLHAVGAHGLALAGTADYSSQGFTASDVIKNIAGRFCPMLSTAGVQDTTSVIPQLAFRDPLYPYDAWLYCNQAHLWALGVWEKRTLHFAPPADLGDYTWQVRLSDFGVSVDLQGDSTDDLANGIVVTYQDVQKGAQNRVTPDDYPELRDDAVENPANRAGLTVWTELNLSIPTTLGAALEIGRAALAEFNTPKAPGTINVRGHIRDRAGHWQQVWKVRAEDTIAIVDHPNDRPRLISETSYNHESKTLQIAVEGGVPKRLDAILDRHATALAAANLS